MDIKITGDWQFSVDGKVFDVIPPEPRSVCGELHRGCYGKDAYSTPNWTSGQRLLYTVTYETSLPDSLVPGSVVLKDEAGNLLEEGVDYAVCWKWGTFWILGGGRQSPGCTVIADYQYRWQRVDAVFQDGAGNLRYAKGEYASSCPAIPEALEGERRLLNIRVLPEMPKLEMTAIFPVLVDEFDDTEWEKVVSAQQKLIPAAIGKLQRGETLRIFAWGDSITEGAFLRHCHRWQNRLVEWLRTEYPRATIELDTLAWGGRRMRTFRDEPAGSPWNYKEQVLPRAEKADLVISEFNNDQGEPLDFLQEQYSQVLADFRARNAEWIILSSNYSMPAWMPFPEGKQTEQGDWLLEDPRDAMHFMKRFAAENGLPFADGAREYGRIWKKGIPYTVLLTNNINHPDERGMAYLFQALKPIFKAQ